MAGSSLGALGPRADGDARDVSPLDNDRGGETVPVVDDGGEGVEKAGHQA